MSYYMHLSAFYLRLCHWSCCCPVPRALLVNGWASIYWFFTFSRWSLVFSLNPLTIPLSGAFLLYLIFINIYVDTPPSCERKKQQSNILPHEYPVGLTLLCFSGLYLTFFVWFDLDDAIIFLMSLSWLFFLLSKWRWQVVALNALGGVGLFWFFSSGFVDIKYHKNIIVRALIKISLLDSLLFIIFSLSLFINMLFWLEEWQRTRQPLKKDEWDIFRWKWRVSIIKMPVGLPQTGILLCPENPS